MDDNRYMARPRFNTQTGEPIIYDDEQEMNLPAYDEMIVVYEETEIEPEVPKEVIINREETAKPEPYHMQWEQEPAPKPKKKRKGFKRLAGLIASGILFGAIAGSTMYGIYYAGGHFFPFNSKKSDVSISTVTVTDNSNKNSVDLLNERNAAGGIMDVKAVVKAAMPAVVAINGTVTSSGGNIYGFPFGSSQRQTSGTGIIIGKNDTELLIVTNAHVVDGVSDLKVTFIDEQGIDAVVKGSRPEKDVAVVAVKISAMKDSTLESIAIAELGDSDGLEVGEQVVAIGNALGEGQSATVGWVSALNRTIEIENTRYTNLIMTDAAINPGNSGGALLDASGKVIGINSAKYASEEVEGMGYAIPISSVKDIIDTLMNRETKDKVSADQAAFLGVSCTSVTSEAVQSYGFPSLGALIQSIEEGSAAEKAGLLISDIITAVDDESITTIEELVEILQYYSAGETVTIQYYRLELGKYELYEVNVELGKRPADSGN